MNRADSAQPTPPPSQGDAPVAATHTFRRPTKADAIELARARFLAGERLEMGLLAEELSVSRTTLYRWVGEREQLIGEVIALLVDEWVALVEPQAEGTGSERFLNMLRRFLEVAASFEPLTNFTQREPTLAMRVLMDPSGAVTDHANQVLKRLLDEINPEVEVSDQIGNGIGLVARSLVWANIATGQEPDIDGAVNLASTLLQASGLEAPSRA